MAGFIFQPEQEFGRAQRHRADTPWNLFFPQFGNGLFRGDNISQPQPRRRVEFGHGAQHSGMIGQNIFQQSIIREIGKRFVDEKCLLRMHLNKIIKFPHRCNAAGRIVRIAQDHQIMRTQKRIQFGKIETEIVFLFQFELRCWQPGLTAVFGIFQITGRDNHSTRSTRIADK